MQTSHLQVGDSPRFSRRSRGSLCRQVPGIGVDNLINDWLLGMALRSDWSLLPAMAPAHPFRPLVLQGLARPGALGRPDGPAPDTWHSACVGGTGEAFGTPPPSTCAVQSSGPRRAFTPLQGAKKMGQKYHSLLSINFHIFPGAIGEICLNKVILREFTHMLLCSCSDRKLWKCFTERWGLLEPSWL